jgi:hypothetical protein
MAVDREKFAELGGFDPVFLPGRLEDLDFAFRGFLAGYHARYVPAAIAYHRGMATFARVFGHSGCDQLALRNTLVFQWKNLRHPAHLARQLLGFPARFILDLLRAPWTLRSRRWAFTRAFFGALARRRGWRAASRGTHAPAGREREFFARFHPRRLARSAVMQRLPKTSWGTFPTCQDGGNWQVERPNPANPGTLETCPTSFLAVSSAGSGDPRRAQSQS